MIIEDIRHSLKEYIDEDYKSRIDQYFTGDQSAIALGVRTGDTRKVARKFYKQIKDQSKKEIFDLCEDLLKTEYNEETTIAFEWAYRLKKQYDPSDFTLFEEWLEKYVDNWGKCDDFCTNAFGELLFQYPELLPHVKQWTSSDNRWFRRAAAVIFIYSIRKEKYMDEVFIIADLLLEDPDDLVQKGYGWMLKVASQQDQKRVFDFVMERKQRMPRTALRYAIEKMPDDLRTEAMKKDW